MADSISSEASGTNRKSVRALPSAFVAGSNGPLWIWAKALIEAAAGELRIPVSIHADLPSAQADGSTQRLIMSEAPDAAFAAAAMRGRGPKLLFVGDAANDFAYQQRIVGLPRFEAMRAITAAAVLCELRPGASLAVRLSTRPARAIIEKVLAALGWNRPLSEGLLRTFAGEANDEPLWSAVEKFCARHLPEGRAPQLDEAIVSSKAIQSAVAPIYQSAATGTQPAEIIWPRPCFFDGDNPGQVAPPWIEVAGGARILFYGPYLHLPRGQWRVTAKLAFSDDLDKSAFSIEVVSDQPLARGRIKPQRSGVFTASFDFAHTNAAHPLEVRISTDHGLIFGRMALIDVRFTPVTAAGTDVES